MYSGNQSSFSNSLDCGPLCNGPHPEGKPSIRNPVINRGGEFASSESEAQQEASVWLAGWAPMDCVTLLTGREETIMQRFSFSRVWTNVLEEKRSNNVRV